MPPVQKRVISLLFALALAVILIDHYAVPEPDSTFHAPSNEAASPVISASRVQHILYGDETGGGHKHGIGAPCKSEFPASWDDERIVSTVSRIAANDNVSWRKEQNGYYVGEEIIDGVTVRVVLGPNKREVITSYPTNVERNPCPSQHPANDN